MMRLDPPDNREVDYSKTRNNVTNWFDTEYSKYQRLANIPEISSVRMSLAPKSNVHANGIEDLTVPRAKAKQVLEFVEAVKTLRYLTFQGMIWQKLLKQHSGMTVW